MWPSFLKALLVYGIVLGIEQIALSRYYSKGSRVLATRWLISGSSSIVISALALWLIRTGYLVAWGVPVIVFWSMLMLIAWFAGEIYITVRLEHQPWTSFFDKLARPVPNAHASPREPMPDPQVSKAQVVMIGLFMGLFALQFAVVSVIVSPELLSITWWIVIVALGFLFGVLLGLYIARVGRVTRT